MLEIAEKHPDIWGKMRPSLLHYDALLKEVASREPRKVEVIILCGETRTGKTTMAMANLPEKDRPYVIHAARGLKWWGGYTGQKTVLIDEYLNQVPISMMLGLLDWNQFQLDVKHTYTYAQWTKVWITTNLMPHQIHPNAKSVSRDAFFERVAEVRHLTKPYNRPEGGLCKRYAFEEEGFRILKEQEEKAVQDGRPVHGFIFDEVPRNQEKPKLITTNELGQILVNGELNEEEKEKPVFGKLGGISCLF